MPIANDTSALVPAVWEAAMQIPIRKSLVALEIASTDLQESLTYGDTIHKGYITELSAVAYVPGTEVTPDALTATDDTISISTRICVPFYIDDTDRLQAKPDYAAAWAEDAAYQIRDSIDTEVLQQVTAGIEFGESTAATGTYITGTATQTITATSGNIMNVFVSTRTALREGNVEEAGDWIAVVRPEIAALIELIAADKGFQIADATLRNGYAGNFLGFKIYVSNNMVAKHAYIGKRGMIDLVMQAGPKMEIHQANKLLGKYFIAWVLYGKQVFVKSALRFLDVDIETS